MVVEVVPVAMVAVAEEVAAVAAHQVRMTVVVGVMVKVKMAVAETVQVKEAAPEVVQGALRVSISSETNRCRSLPPAHLYGVEQHPSSFPELESLAPGSELGQR